MSASRLLLAAATASAIGAPQAQGREEPFDPFGAARIDPRPGAQIPLDGRFRDAAGRDVSLSELARGKPIVLVPVQHRCLNICGLTLEGLRAAIAGQSYRPGRDFELIALGIDPREGQEAAKLSVARLSGSGQNGGVAAVVGPRRQVARVTDALGYHYRWDPRIGQYAHVAGVAVLTPTGRLASWLYGVAPAPAALHQAVSDARSERAGSLGEALKLICYHYDPQTGRYSGLVIDVARGIGVATVALLAGLMAWLSHRTRRGPA